MGGLNKKQGGEPRRQQGGFWPPGNLKDRAVATQDRLRSGQRRENTILSDALGGWKLPTWGKQVEERNL